MPRKVEDIIPKEKRSIREVSSPSRSVVATKKRKKVIELDGEEQVPVHIGAIDNRIDNKTKAKVAEDMLSVKSDFPLRRMPITPPSSEYEAKKKIKWKWPVITILAIIIVGVIGYYGSIYYSQATFTVVPKVIPVSVNSTYVAQASGNDLTYEVITVKRTATTTVNATNGPVTNTKATGKITLYNSYGTQSIRLIAGTRLSYGNLVYRLNSSVVIPGYTKPAGTIVPGKISTTISADQPGQQYNIEDISSADFKIVAYAGSPKYSTVTAKAITPIIGGFSGVKKVISPATLSSSTANLKSQLTELLLKESSTMIPSGYVMYSKNYTTSFSAPIIGGSDPKTANISMEGTIHAIAMPKTKLVETLAGAQTISLFGPFAYTSPGLEELDITITNIKDFTPTKKNALVLKAKGDMKIVGTIPVEDLKKKLSGLSLSATQDVFKSYSAIIESGSGELAPPWANIPTDLEKIKVIVEEP